MYIFIHIPSETGQRYVSATKAQDSALLERSVPKLDLSETPRKALRRPSPRRKDTPTDVQKSDHRIPYHITCCHVTSYQVIPHHFTPCHIFIPFHVDFYHTVSYHTKAGHIISCHTRSHHTISYHVISYQTIAYHIIFVFM